jgi:preprotein translocase subunit SecA
MPSSSLAITTGAMRPGLVTGHYPERGDSEHSWLVRSGKALQGVLGRLNSNRQGSLSKVAAAINLQGETLTALDRQQLDSLRINLRRQFRRCGLSHPLCVQSFALIRELSGRTLQQRHYDSQLMGGWTMLQGQLAEMETGEGKTLAATLAAATAALAGIPVHVITVNEYLVERDAKMLEPLYRALGLTVGYVTQEMETEQRRAAYACDITYCTNKQVAFDYLRDRLLLGNDRSPLRLQLESAYVGHQRMEQFLLRGLCFAIVDEADSVLIDEAQTPLILTRNAENSAENVVYRLALHLAQKLILGRDFAIDPQQRSVQLSLTGQQTLAALKLTMAGPLQNSRRREELVCQALHALHLLHRDRDYLVKDKKIVLIDSNTGRTMPDRSWERGLHQLVEAKESCPLTAAREHLGRLTYQRFFRRYLRLGGMTGTAREVRSELWSVYGLRVQRIPLHRPSQCRELPARIYAQAEEKWSAVLSSVTEIRAQGRPVLIGTGSVGDSELLSGKLTAANIPHRVLNARQDKEEAEVVAAAGRAQQVTVATNMAGRGTDIPLATGIAERGGLHVIATCRNDARRIDRQLFGRCARQGDPGSHQSILAFQDGSRKTQLAMERRHREARRALLQHDQQTGRMLAFSGHME